MKVFLKLHLFRHGDPQSHLQVVFFGDCQTPDLLLLAQVRLLPGPLGTGHPLPGTGHSGGLDRSADPGGIQGSVLIKNKESVEGGSVLTRLIKVAYLGVAVVDVFFEGGFWNVLLLLATFSC